MATLQRRLQRLTRLKEIIFRILHCLRDAEAGVQRCSGKKLFLKNLQNLEESTCAGVSFANADLEPATLLIERLMHSCFPMNFVTSLRAPRQETSPDDCSGKYSDRIQIKFFCLGQYLDTRFCYLNLCFDRRIYEILLSWGRRGGVK